MTTNDKSREERLAAALRENLRRRKAQTRSLAEEPRGKGDGKKDCQDDS